MRDNLIWVEEECWGFLEDIIRMLRHELKRADDGMATLINEAIDNARALITADEDYFVYKMWFNPMGSFVFVKLTEQQ